MAELAIPSSAFPPAYEFDYVPITSNATSTQTVEASATTVITGNAVTYDGSTTIWITLWAHALEEASGAIARINIWRKVGAAAATDLGRVLISSASGAGLDYSPIGKVRDTPPAGAIIYTARMWTTAGTVTLYAGAGGAGTVVNAHLTQTKV